MVTTTRLQHVRDQLSGDRRPALVFFILPRIRKEGHDGRDPPRAGDPACMNHDAHLHKRRVDVPAASVDDVHIFVSNRLDDTDI
jgi:hypothetical protein